MTGRRPEKLMNSTTGQWDSTTERLVRFAERARYDDLPADVVSACKLRLVDTFASALGAADASLSSAARKIAARTRGSDEEASVWGSTLKTTPDVAAFTNGVLVRLLDISDTYLGRSRGHPSDMTSGLVAVAESVRADGKSLISAMVLAYDIYCSFCDEVDVNSKGWDQPMYGVLGCVLGAGRLLGLTREQLGNAVSLALAPNLALAQARRGNLSAWKGCAGANASRNAVFAAQLARDGFTGPTAVFEGDGGLWQVLGGRFDWPLPEDRHLIGTTHIKGLPVCYHAQSSVWAALELRERVDAARVEDIQIDTYGTAVMMTGGDPTRWAPATRETADHSLPYCVAVALLDGKVTDESFADARLTDATVGALMRKVKVREDRSLTEAYPEGAPGRVTIRMTSGETHTRELRYPKGHAKSPMSGADVERKFRDLGRDAPFGRAMRCGARGDREPGARRRCRPRSRAARRDRACAVGRSSAIQRESDRDMTASRIQDILDGHFPERRPGNGKRMDTHAPRFQGRHFVPARVRRLRFSPAADRGAEHASQLCDGSFPAHRGLRRRGRWLDRALRRERPAVRNAGRRRSRWSAGSTIRIPTRFSRSTIPWNSCVRSRTCGRAPT